MTDQPKPTPDDLLAECDAEKDFEFGELQRFVDALRAAIKERNFWEEECAGARACAWKEIRKLESERDALRAELSAAIKERDEASRIALVANSQAVAYMKERDALSAKLAIALEALNESILVKFTTFEQFYWERTKAVREALAKIEGMK